MESAEKITVAVIDDHNQLRDSICGLLEELGFQVLFQASNGKDALEYLSKPEMHPNVCLLDVNMPVMNGYDTAKEISTKYPDTEIMAISVDTAGTGAAGMVKSGATGFLSTNSHPMKFRDAIIKMKDKGYYFDSEGINALLFYIRRR